MLEIARSFRNWKTTIKLSASNEIGPSCHFRWKCFNCSNFRSNLKLLQVKIALGNKKVTLKVKRKLHLTLLVISLYSLKINLDFDV